MAELSNHSYHYDRNLIVSLPSFDPSMDIFDSMLPEHELVPPLPNEEETAEDSNSTGKGKKGTSKKKPRRKRRNLTGVSKQRRAANERERKRLQIINVAFKDLKAALPLFPNENNISKIEIVKLASTTIKYLAELLNGRDSDDINSMDGNTRSPGGSEASDQSESGCSTSTESSGFPDFEEEAKLLNPEDIDISNLLSNYEELNPSMVVDLQPPSFLLLDEIKSELKSENRYSCLGSSCTSSSSSSLPASMQQQQHQQYQQQPQKLQQLQKSSTGSSLFGSSSSLSSSSTTPSTSPTTTDGFSGFDINLFLNDPDSEESKDDVFPSMLSFW